MPLNSSNIVFSDVARLNILIISDISCWLLCAFLELPTNSL